MAKGIKTGGRSRNTPNKLTKEIRASLTLILNKELEQLPFRLNSLNNKDRLIVLMKLLPLVIPKPLDELDEQKLITIWKESFNNDGPIQPVIITIAPVPDSEKLPNDESQVDLKR